MFTYLLTYLLTNVCMQVPYNDGTQQWMCRTKTDERMARMFLLMDFALCMLLPLLFITFFYTAIAITLVPHCCSKPGKSPPLNTRVQGKVPSLMHTGLLSHLSRTHVCKVGCPKCCTRPVYSPPLNTCMPGQLHSVVQHVCLVTSLEHLYARTTALTAD